MNGFPDEVYDAPNQAAERIEREAYDEGLDQGKALVLSSLEDVRIDYAKGSSEWLLVNGLISEVRARIDE